jgi:PEP-CTERM motif
MKTIRDNCFNAFGSIIAILACLASVQARLDAAIVNYTSLAAFNSVVGPHPLIKFDDLPSGTILNNQYSGLGVLFPDGNDTTQANDSFLTDGVGLTGANQDVNAVITVQFTSAINAVGADFPGALRIQIFNGATLVGTSANFGSAGTGFFGGIVSDMPFDRAILSDWMDDRVFVDNLHFASVPEPSAFALALIGAGALWIRRSRLARAARSRTQV